MKTLLLRFFPHMHALERDNSVPLRSHFQNYERKATRLYSVYSTLSRSNRKEMNEVPIRNERLFRKLTALLSWHVSTCVYPRSFACNHVYMYVFLHIHVYRCLIDSYLQVSPLLFIAYICKYFMCIGGKASPYTAISAIDIARFSIPPPLSRRGGYYEASKSAPIAL
jgi:hypothetical protein